MSTYSETFVRLAARSEPFLQWAEAARRYWQSMTGSDVCYWYSSSAWADMWPVHEDADALLAELDASGASDNSPIKLSNDRCAWPLLEAGWLICQGGTLYPDHESLQKWQGIQNQWLLRGRLERAERGMTTASRLIDSLTHDMRSPLNNMTNFLDMLDKQSGDWEEQLPQISREIVRLTQLVDHVIEFSQLHSSKVDIVPTAVNVMDWASSLVEPWRSNMPQQIELRLVLGDDLPDAVEIDGDQLRQVAHHLISNAVKQTAEGHIEVALTMGDQPGKLCLNVSDTGRGVDAAALAHLFAADTQVHNLGQVYQVGAGLGLNIVKQLTELMHGDVTVTSAVGAGSVFCVQVPFAAATDPLQGSLLSSMLGQAVLMVADNGRRQSGLRRMLRYLGAQVAGPFTGPETLLDLHHYARQPDWIMISADLAGVGAERILEKIVAQLQWSAETIRERVIWIRNLSDAETDIYRNLVMPVVLAELQQLVTFVPESTCTLPVSSAPAVLVVDDTETNLQLSDIQLSKLGLAVTAAESGEAALSAISAHTFDMIFMDLMMPAMDGFETTRRIREREAAQGVQRTPIVALTADAVLSSPDKCRAAGMDDYLTKPYRTVDLRRVVNRYIPDSRQRPKLDNMLIVDEKPQPADADLVHWQQALAMVGGDEAILQTVLGPFLADLPSIHQRLEMLVEQADWEALQHSSHSLKSMLRTFGAHPLGNAAQQLETGAADGDRVAVDRAWDMFIDLYSNTHSLLVQYGRPLDATEVATE